MAQIRREEPEITDVSPRATTMFNPLLGDENDTIPVFNDEELKTGDLKLPKGSARFESQEEVARLLQL